MAWTVTYVSEFESWLRVQHRGDPYRVLFAFDRLRQAVLLLGGCKRGDARWYERNIPIADSRFEAWQAQFHETDRKRSKGRKRRGR